MEMKAGMINPLKFKKKTLEEFQGFRCFCGGFYDYSFRDIGGLNFTTICIYKHVVDKIKFKFWICQ
jgi:hypothetical protein